MLRDQISDMFALSDMVSDTVSDIVLDIVFHQLNDTGYKNDVLFSFIDFVVVSVWPPF